MNVLTLLLTGASKPDRIGRRVFLLDHALRRGDGSAEKGKALAKKLGVSEARVSIGVAQAERLLDELLGEPES